MCSSVSGHYIWQSVSEDLQSTSLIFSEKAGAAGAKYFLPSLKDKLTVSAQSTKEGSVATEIPFSEKGVGGVNGEFYADIPSALSRPYALESFCPYGIFTEAGPTALLQVRIDNERGDDSDNAISSYKNHARSYFRTRRASSIIMAVFLILKSNPFRDSLRSLHQYYTSAPQITTPNDWFPVQDMLKNKFEVTLRDPYMSKESDLVSVGVKRMGNGVSADECPSGEDSVDGKACIVAVVRFDGELHDPAVNVTTFDAIGETISTVECESVCILKVPMSGPLFAAVQYKEMNPGTFEGTDYEYVDHWATTYTVVKRD